jgi:hypothetical protein
MGDFGELSRVEGRGEGEFTIPMCPVPRLESNCRWQGGWVNYLLKQSVPTHRPFSVRSVVPAVFESRPDGCRPKASRPDLSPSPSLLGEGRGEGTFFVSV